MSTRREREPIIPDRLPGEQELSRLYQQTPDERPAATLDAAILAEARRATRPRLRLLKGGKRLDQFSRRWAIPMSLAAALLVTVGVVSYLQNEQNEIDEIGWPLTRSQALETGARLLEADAPYAQRDDSAQQEERKKSDKLALPKDAAPPKNEVMRPALQPQTEQSMQSVLPSASSEYRQGQDKVPMSAAAPAPVTKQAPQLGTKPTKAKREQSPELRQRRKSQDEQVFVEKERDARILGIATEEAEPSLMDALEDQRMDLPAEPEKRSPQEWLKQISELFRVEKHQEAEDSLTAFQKQHPDYTDYPDSFPEDVLARLRKR